MLDCSYSSLKGANFNNDLSSLNKIVTEGCVARERELLRLLLEDIRSCRVCLDAPLGEPLPHLPRPVLRASASARILVSGQAPGVRVHASGVPFSDPSGDRLRRWMGVTAEEFYDERRIAIVPMGFCFPGNDASGGDLPPRRECAARWRERLIALLPEVSLVLLVGTYAQQWHLRKGGGSGARSLVMTETVRSWRELLECELGPALMPLPHPSWRNNAWLKRNPWFEARAVPELKKRIRVLLEG
jgi:uracil-DNA glycosylase